ncbi:MAG TPA: hypothetical protein ENK57_05080 [Polyangiaceae bacterium]|nr:hypothetical protein [Polyangiaceae bacterium]
MMSLGTALLLTLQLLGLSVAPASAVGAATEVTAPQTWLGVSELGSGPTAGHPDLPHDARRSMLETETEAEASGGCLHGFQGVQFVRSLVLPVVMTEARYTAAVRSSHAARAPPPVR